MESAPDAELMDGPGARAPGGSPASPPSGAEAGREWAVVRPHVTFGEALDLMLIQTAHTAGLPAGTAPPPPVPDLRRLRVPCCVSILLAASFTMLLFLTLLWGVRGLLHDAEGLDEDECLPLRTWLRRCRASVLGSSMAFAPSLAICFRDTAPLLAALPPGCPEQAPSVVWLIARLRYLVLGAALAVLGFVLVLFSTVVRARRAARSVLEQAINYSREVVEVAEGQDCAICLETHRDCAWMYWNRLPCGHVFHEECLKECIRLHQPRQVCPLCRSELGHNSAAAAAAERGFGATTRVA